MSENRLRSRMPSRPANPSGAPKTSRPVSKPQPVRRPRVALMGEFSAGKSTLSNLLIGKSALPVNVTATQLPRSGCPLAMMPLSASIWTGSSIR